MDAAKLLQEANTFLSFVNRIYGLYLDAILGFERNVHFTKEQQYNYIRKAADRQQAVSLEKLDQAVWEYDRRVEEEPRRSQHKTTFGDFTARNGMTGPNAGSVS